jgi:HAD superfamily hydrolase (TIGR01509 family)
MHIIKQHFKAIIFDMDGTIIQTDKAWQSITHETLERCNIIIETLPEEAHLFLKKLAGAGFIEAFSMMKEYFKLTIPLDHVIEHAKDIAHKKFETEIDFIHGFQDFHLILQKHNIPSGLATNAHRTHLDLLAKKLNFHQFFDKHLYASSDVENRAKPDPALFLHTAKQLGVLPHECIVFEDSKYGFQAAQAAGMKCIAIEHPNNFKDRHLVHGSIASYHDALEILHTLCKEDAPALIEKASVLV